MIAGFRRPPAILAGGLLAACSPSAEGDRDASSGPTASAELPNLPVTERPMDRRALIMAIYEAASARAAGRPDAEAQRALSGKRFEIRQRFGCPGDVPGRHTWTLDEDERVLRLRIEPDVTGSTPLVGQLGLGDAEKVLGFWIDRPWLLDAACPAPAPTPTSSGIPKPSASDGAEPPAGPSLAPRFAVAQAFSAQDARTHLGGGSPLDATVRMADGEEPSRVGYDLVLSGRLERSGKGPVVLCGQTRRDAPPACIVSVEFDRVAVSKPDGEVIAEWTSG